MGVLLLMYSRYKGSCTLQRCLLQAPTSCCSRIWFKRGLSRLNIVFSESRDMAGLRFLGRQLSVKTSLLIVTGPAQCLVNTGACRVIRGEWGRVRAEQASSIRLFVMSPPDTWVHESGGMSLIPWLAWLINDNCGMWVICWDKCEVVLEMKCEKVTVPPPETDHWHAPGLCGHLSSRHPVSWWDPLRNSSDLRCGEKWKIKAFVSRVCALIRMR